MIPPSPTPLPTPAPDATKSMWRRWARARRAALEAEERRAIDAAIVAALRAWPPFATARDVLTYLAFGDEVDLGALLDAPGVRFHAPRSHDGSRTLTLHPLGGGALERHGYGYLQPPANAPVTPPERIDLVLVPGLAFDVAGTRLGYGLGFYDRLLPRLRSDARRVGVSAEALRVARLPGDPHDVPMTHLAGEGGVRAVPTVGREPVP